MSTTDVHHAIAQGACAKMFDYAYTDPRSVAAMLRGRGDGRERKFLRFAERMRRRDPLLGDSAIAAAYTHRCEIDSWCRLLGPGWLVWPISFGLAWWQMRPVYSLLPRQPAPNLQP